MASRRGGASSPAAPLCLLVTLLAWLPTIGWAGAEQVFQTTEAFIKERFDGSPPAPAAIWLTGERGALAKRILGHEPDRLRLRYWPRAKGSVWVLEEIGKERPITVGIDVRDGALELLRVLVYRESRGWEVRLPAFTKQFVNRRLTQDDILDGPIDSISGATLSVRALIRLARLALALDRQLSQ